MRALRGERVRDVEMVIGHPDGRRRTVLASGQRIVDRDGSALGAVVALHDVTERKAAQRGLEEATRRLESILSAAGEGICGLDPEGRISYANPAAARLTGYPVEDLIGRGLDELLAPLRAGWADGGEVVPGQGPREDTAVVLRRDGSSVPAEYVLTGVDDDAGAGVVVMRDVSERRAVEQMKDEFVALASHELRTPLTSILGYLEVVLDEYEDDLPPEPRRLLQVAERNARRLADLVSDVLVAAQADAGRLRLDMGAVDLRALVLECVEGARPAAEERKLTLSVDAEALPAVTGDRGRLTQVLDNLISNALKFTPPGGRVQVAGGREDGRAVVRVADTGMGIPEREVERLFTRFYRSSSAVRAAVPGTGLGLAITKMIVEGHGGSVEVESEEGVGSTFWVALPIGGPPPTQPTR
jgi:PAS domain S-box-containing protein